MSNSYDRDVVPIKPKDDVEVTATKKPDKPEKEEKPPKPPHKPEPKTV